MKRDLMNGTTTTPGDGYIQYEAKITDGRLLDWSAHGVPDHIEVYMAEDGQVSLWDGERQVTFSDATIALKGLKIGLLALQAATEAAAAQSVKH